MKYFGTDGFRGKANESLTALQAYKVGVAYGKQLSEMNENPFVYIGQDTRLSSAMLEHALAAGFSSMGVKVGLLGVIPTPAVSYLTNTSPAVGAVMVSASHNPYWDNGLKLFNENGEKVREEVEALIEKYIDDEIQIAPVASEKIGEIVDVSYEIDRYLNYLAQHVRFQLNGKKVVLDCANGATVTTAQRAFEKSSAQLIVVANQPNGLNINDKVGSTHLEKLRETILENKADFGFAFDGDGDRCIAMDHLGNEVNGDHVLYMLGKSFKEKGELTNNLVVTTVMANLGLFRALSKEQIDSIKTKVGDKYVYEEMKNKDGVIGGEQSGHIIFRKLASTGDGVLTAMLVAQLVSEKNQSLYDLHKDLMIFPQTLKNLKVTDKQAVLLDKEVNNYIEQKMKELGQDGRILVRPSGTEPLVRVMAEALTQEKCDELVDDIIRFIQQKGY